MKPQRPTPGEAGGGEGREEKEKNGRGLVRFLSSGLENPPKYSLDIRKKKTQSL